MSDRRPITAAPAGTGRRCAVLAGTAARAAESPVGKVVAQIIPVNNKASPRS